MGGFVPHTSAEIEAMLGFLGLDSLDDLFAHIPEAVRLAGGVPVEVFAGEDAGYLVTVEQLETARTDRTKVLLFCSPSNPTGAVRSTDSLRGFLAWGRERGVPVVSDECYLTLGWEQTPGSMLADEVCGGDYTGVLALHSLSKRSNLAGYRAGMVSGDRALIAELLEVRKHAGMIVPAPVQAAMAAALRDEEHVDEQRARYARRRATLRAALEKAEFNIEHSGAGLYLWATRGEDCWQTMDWLAARGILGSPGTLYGDEGACYVRFALTATDERIEAAVGRLVG
jgi:succinyldiaminopimelate transaminase